MSNSILNYVFQKEGLTIGLGEQLIPLEMACDILRVSW